MRPASTLGMRARAVALLALGALGLHQARYLLVPGVGGHGHDYLQALIPVLLGACAAAAAVSLLAGLALRCLPAVPARDQITDRAAGFAIALIAVYCVQELAEGLLAGEHGPFAGLIGPGSWLALPLAMALGALIACVSQWLDRAELRVAVAFLGRTLPRAPRLAARPPGYRGRAPAFLKLAFGLSPRPPPPAPAG